MQNVPEKGDRSSIEMGEPGTPLAAGVPGAIAPGREQRQAGVAPAAVGQSWPGPLGRMRRLAERVRVPRSGPLAYLVALGPGIIAANAGNDAGGIATYSSVSASYGYSLLWMIALITIDGCDHHSAQPGHSPPGAVTG